MSEQLPSFATNRSDTGETVASQVNRLFRMLREEYVNKPFGAIATAYINPGGFHLLADELEQVPRLRLLLGAEPEQETLRAPVAGRGGRVRRALDEGAR